MNLIAKLLILSEVYSASTGTNLRLLSDRIFSDRRRIENLQAGSTDLNTRSYEKAMLWFSANWPEGLEWPDGVDRPAAVDDATDEAAA